MADATIEERIASKIDKEVTGAITVAGTGGAMNLVPRNMNEVMEFAKVMSSGGVCIPPAFRNNPGMCMAVTMQALRWGMDPFAVANKAYVVKGKGGDEKLAYEAQLFHAVVNERAPLTKRLKISYDGSGVARTCTIEGWLKGEEEAKVYTSPPIQNISVKNSPLWTGDSDQQLSYYAIRAWARKWVPEIIMGVYTVEELAAEPAHRGPDNAKDITPARPRLEDYKDEPADFDLFSQFGEVMGTFGPRGWQDAMLHQLSQFKSVNLEKTAFETFIENNQETMERLRDSNADAAKELSDSITHTLEKMYPPKVVEPDPVDAHEPPPQEAQDAPETVSEPTQTAPVAPTDPDAIIWHDSEGKPHEFLSIMALKDEVSKGLKKNGVTAESVRRVIDNNKAQLAALRAEGGPGAAMADDISDMLEKRLQEFDKK